MPNWVVVGPVRSVEPGRLTLGGNLHIIVPPDLVLPDLPLGCSVTVVVHEQADGQLLAENIQRRKGKGLLA